MPERTPLYSALIKEAEKKTLRMHMPGHKGRPVETFGFSDIFEIDFTELSATGNLYEGIPPISDAEELMAKAAAAKDCFFLTGGATQGIMAAMAAACPPGSCVIIDRASHRSVWSAMVHLDLRPEYIFAEKLAPYGIAAPITAEEVESLLKKTPDASAVVITSPSYYGVLSDISKISKITRKYGVPLIVDEAHGAHLPFIHGCRGAVAQGASLSVASAHKTLPALTAGAFLFSAGEYEPREIRRMAALFGTSSPSYAVMASMDAARAYMEGEGGARYNRIAEEVEKLWRKLNDGGRFRALSEEAGLKLDPTRLTVNTAAAGISGYAAAGLLESDYSIVCEMADSLNIVMIITCADTEEDLARIYASLIDLGNRAIAGDGAMYGSPITADPPHPVR
jgi:arginine/lysine/ornithine decarboxylase